MISFYIDTISYVGLSDTKVHTSKYSPVTSKPQMDYLDCLLNGTVIEHDDFIKSGSILFHMVLSE